ncbi:MAG TPA: peroxiredoxin family protein [Flavobacteriales bacterium]
MPRRFHPFTTLAVGLLPVAAACHGGHPQVAAVLLALAYGGALLEFKTHTGHFQFAALVVIGTALGGVLDLAAGSFPLLTGALAVAAVATVLRQMYMPRFTYVNHLWMEPALLGIAAVAYPYTLSTAEPAWTTVVLPLLPLGAACGLSFGYIQDGMRMKRMAAKGYRIRIGFPAPDFELPDQSGVPSRLSDHRGKNPVLLIFVRGDWCPGCHMMLRTYERSRERFLEKGVHVIGIGPDSVDVNQDMVQRIGVGYQLLSDAQQRVSQRYGVVYDNPIIELAVDYAQGIPLPASFLVDIDGVVRYVSRPDRVGEFLDPTLIFGVLDRLPQRPVTEGRAA